MKGFSLIEFLIVAAIVAILAVIVGAVWRDATAETMELRKDEWACKRRETYTYTTYVSTGKMMIPIQNVGQRCAAWERLP